MKIKIGPYRSYWSSLRFLELWYQIRYNRPNWEINNPDKLDKTIEKLCDIWDDTVCKLINATFKSPDRKIDIRIDPYDVWNLDHTLALIIRPALLKLKEVKHGSGTVADEDVPEHLRSINGIKEHGTDSLVHARWDWVLDEMIWSFEQILDDSYKDQFHVNQDNSDITWEPFSDKGYSQLSINNQVDKTKPAYYLDSKGLMAYENRINNGLRLFGVYFRNLWD